MKKEDLKIFINIPSIRTRRLLLRKISMADCMDMFEYSSDERVCEFLLWSPHTHISETQNKIRNIERKYKQAEFFDWGVEFDGKLIGAVGFTSLSLSDNSGEIGYVLNSKYWGNGIATEAVSAVIQFGFERLNLSRIECRYIKENIASEMVSRKCNLVSEGCLRSSLIVKGERRDICVSSILSCEYFSR